MEWQNIDLRITQFSSYLNSVTCSKPKYQRPVTVFSVDDNGSETFTVLQPVKSGVNCTAGVYERKTAPFAAMFVLKFIFVSASSRALRNFDV